MQAGQEGEAGDGDHATRRANRHLSRLPFGRKAECDANQVQQARADDEAGGIGDRVGGRRQLRSVRVAVEDGEGADDDRRDPQRRPRAERHHDAEHHGRGGDARLDAGSGAPAMPSAPPKAITSGKTIGSSQIAGAPRKAPQRPTATIAATWSQPRIGCRKPDAKPPATLEPSWAKAGAAVAKTANAARSGAMRSMSFQRSGVYQIGEV